VDGEQERRVAEEVALVGGGDDRPVVEVALGDLAGRAEGGDGQIDRGVRELAGSLGRLLRDVKAAMARSTAASVNSPGPSAAFSAMWLRISLRISSRSARPLRKWLISSR